jgi:hypothetical protein
VRINSRRMSVLVLPVRSDSVSDALIQLGVNGSWFLLGFEPDYLSLMKVCHN